MKTSKLLFIALIVTVSTFAIFFLINCREDKPLAQGASGTEDFLQVDSIIIDKMGTDQHAPPPGVTISAKTGEQIEKEREILIENTKKAIEESKLKSVSCEEIFQQYAKVMDDCLVRDNCQGFDSFPNKDIAFTRCREKSKARYDSLELKYR